MNFSQYKLQQIHESENKDNDVTLGDPKIEKPSTEGLDNAKQNAEQLVAASDNDEVKNDVQLSLSDNLNNDIITDFEEDADQDNFIVQNNDGEQVDITTIPAHNEENDQFSEVDDANETDDLNEFCIEGF